MSTKLLAMGNVLMGDDAIALHLATALEDKLSEIGIEVIYGETDIGYSISQINEGDYIIILDGTKTGAALGEVTCYSLESNHNRREKTFHNISFLDLMKLYYPKINGLLITVEVEQIGLYYGLSSGLQDRMAEIAKEIYKKISIIKFAY